jgi:hypothetical protein
MRLPKGWVSEQNDASLILTERTNDVDAPMLALVAVQVAAEQAVSPHQVADAVLAQLNLAAQGVAASTVEERNQHGALYRLHRLSRSGTTGYMASFTYVDARSGLLVHLFFSALEHRFVELGGPMLPLVVFAGMPPSALEEVRRGASRPVSAARGMAPGDRTQADALLDEIVRMGQETRAKTVYSMGNGWCHRGEPDCP